MAAEQVKRRFWLFWRQLIQIDLLTEIIQVAMIASLLIIPIQYFFPAYASWDIACITLSALVLWQTRLRARQLWQFILVCLVLLAVPVLLALPAWPKVILALSVLVLAIRSFILRIRRQESQIQLNLGSTAVVIGYFLALTILTQKLSLTGLTQAYFYIASGYLVLSIWRWHHLALTERLARFAGMPTQPAGRIRRFNRFLLLGYTGIMLILLLVSPWLHLQDIIPWIGQLLLGFLRWLLGLLRFNSGETAETTAEPAATEPTSGEAVLPDAGETPDWLRVLYAVLEYLLYGLIAIALLAGLVYLLYTLYRRFRDSKPHEDDVLESLLPKLPDQVRTRFSRERSRLARQFGQSPDQRIRRLYYRLIEDQAALGFPITAGMTPRQIAGALLQDKALDIGEMTTLYEKARYGAGLCSAADARRMHNLCRDIHRRKDIDSKGGNT